MNKDIENVIRANLPEKKGKYSQYNESATFGFNQALSQINTSLIADEVLKVVVEKIKEMASYAECEIPGEGETSRAYYYHLDRWIFEKLLSNLSTNKENK